MVAADMFSVPSAQSPLNCSPNPNQVYFNRSSIDSSEAYATVQMKPSYPNDHRSFDNSQTDKSIIEPFQQAAQQSKMLESSKNERAEQPRSREFLPKAQSRNQFLTNDSRQLAYQSEQVRTFTTDRSTNELQCQPTPPSILCNQQRLARFTTPFMQQSTQQAAKNPPVKKQQQVVPTHLQYSATIGHTRNKTATIMSDFLSKENRLNLNE